MATATGTFEVLSGGETAIQETEGEPRLTHAERDAAIQRRHRGGRVRSSG